MNAEKSKSELRKQSCFGNGADRRTNRLDASFVRTEGHVRERHDLLPREEKEEDIRLRRKPEFYCICAATKSSIPIISDEVDDCARDMYFIKLEFNNRLYIRSDYYEALCFVKERTRVMLTTRH